MANFPSVHFRYRVYDIATNEWVFSKGERPYAFCVQRLAAQLAAKLNKSFPMPEELRARFKVCRVPQF